METFEAVGVSIKTIQRSEVNITKTEPMSRNALIATNSGILLLTVKRQEANKLKRRGEKRKKKNSKKQGTIGLSLCAVLIHMSGNQEIEARGRKKGSGVLPCTDTIDL